MEVSVDDSMFTCPDDLVGPGKKENSTPFRKVKWLDVVWRDGAPWRQEYYSHDPCVKPSQPGPQDCVCKDPTAKAGFLCPDAPASVEHAYKDVRSPRLDPGKCLCEDPNAKSGFLCPDALKRKHESVLTGQAEAAGNYASTGAAALIKRARTAEETLRAAIRAAKPKQVPVQPGMRVRIEGLMRRKDLNGAEGTVRTWVPGFRGAPGRWAVHCDGELGCVLFELKENNMLILSHQQREDTVVAPSLDSSVPRCVVREFSPESLGDQSAAPWEREYS
jgi:hypothetical protein